MTVTLRHAIKISAPRHQVFNALTDTAEMQSWHVGGIDGSIAIGETFRLNARPGLVFCWRTEELVTDEVIQQTCIEGPGNSVDKILVIKLYEGDSSTTVVNLSDGPWHPDNPDLPFCNTRWAEVLLRLKQYVETDM
jgi:uncharacterized protein YndB with AHSA1/START domain